MTACKPVKKISGMFLKLHAPHLGFAEASLYK